ncbi:MAG: Dimodular non-ribosomal peptide synthetase, thioesterase protein, partial [uncultured bacterium]
YRSDDDFFDSGGDSLLAVMMLERLRARFGLELTGDVLIGRSTLGQLAEYIREQLRNRSTHAGGVEPEYAVRLKPGSPSCPTLFLCHPGAGHLYFYLDLVKHLDIPGAVYGIEAMGLRATEQPLPTIEAIARHHLQQVRLIQGHGPYWLGGSSFGGMVAYEVAQQLLAMGEEVEFLYMVDTPGPGHMVGPVESDARILVSLFADVLGDSAHLTERLLTLEGEPEKQIAYIVQQAHSMGRGRKIPTHFGRHIVHMVRTHVAAMRNYQPKPYPGFLLFFRPSEATADYSAHAEMAWLPLTAKAVNVHTVQGNHITMNMEPNVQGLAAHLRRYVFDNFGYRQGEEVSQSAGCKGETE